MPLCGQKRGAESRRLEEMILALNIVTVAHFCLGEWREGTSANPHCTLCMTLLKTGNPDNLKKSVGTHRIMCNHFISRSEPQAKLEGTY